MTHEELSRVVPTGRGSTSVGGDLGEVNGQRLWTRLGLPADSYVRLVSARSVGRLELRLFRRVCSW